jgi:hypothetical protein
MGAIQINTLIFLQAPPTAAALIASHMPFNAVSRPAPAPCTGLPKTAPISPAPLIRPPCPFFPMLSPVIRCRRCQPATAGDPKSAGGTCYVSGSPLMFNLLATCYGKGCRYQTLPPPTDQPALFAAQNPPGNLAGLCPAGIAGGLCALPRVALRLVSGYSAAGAAAGGCGAVVRCKPTHRLGNARKQKSPWRLPEGFCCLLRRGGGIRTPGGLTLNGFQDRRNRPLCHSSKKKNW